MNRRDWLEHALADCIAIGVVVGLLAAFAVVVIVKTA